MLQFFDQKVKTIKRLLAPGKGILAADESIETISKRFNDLGIENTAENRRAYRELLFSAPGIERFVSGVILYDETIRQSAESGQSFVDMLASKGIVVGVKVDAGLVPFSNSKIERITQGLDGLADRLEKYYAVGARFAKWRAAFTISEITPSLPCIEANARRLASYAKTCQDHGIVPIVEPEILMDGDHNILQTQEATRMVLQTVFKILREEKVNLKTMLLKPNMVVPGEELEMVDSSEVATRTLTSFKESVPPEVPGIVFLSGGQTEEQACANLEALAERRSLYPWDMTYSYGRALQNSAMHAWQGKPENWERAQEVFLAQAERASAARQGKYKEQKQP